MNLRAPSKNAIYLGSSLDIVPSLPLCNLLSDEKFSLS